MIRFVLVGTEQVVQRLSSMPAKVRQGLVDEMKRQWFDLQSYVVRSKLSGQVLRRVTGNLASSINVGGPNTATEFTEEPTRLVGRVGTKVRYGKVHEYGGTFTIASHQSTSRLGKAFQVPEHTVTYPERSFLRSGLQDKSSQIRQAMTSAVRRAMA